MKKLNLLIKISLLFSLASLIYFISSTPVQAASLSKEKTKPKIMWLVEDKAENKGLLLKNSAKTSIASYIESLILKALTRYDIRIERMTISRMTRLLQTKDNVCMANRIKTPKRSENSLFSGPQSFYLSHKLYRFNTNAPLPKSLLNEKGEIRNLVDIFKAFPTWYLGMPQDISFGDFYDKEINKIPLSNLYYRGGTYRIQSLWSMLFKSRVDFILALPANITHNSKKQVLLEKYTIAGAPPYMIAYFNCSKSKLGQEIINDINDALAKIYQSEAYYLAHKAWFTDNELVQLQDFINKTLSEKKLFRFISRDNNHNNNTD